MTSEITTTELPPVVSVLLDTPERLNALYSPFRPRESNPESYDEKMKFWTKAIEEFLSLNRKFTFTVKELQTAFSVNKKSPTCLPDVIALNCRKTILPLKEYDDWLKSSEGWLAWSQVNAKKFLSSFLPSSPFAQSDDNNNIRFIHLSRLISTAETIRSQTPSSTLIPNSTLLDTIKKTSTDPEETHQKLLSYLKTKNSLLSDHIGQEEVVIFSTEPISDVDKGKYDVHRTKEKLEIQLEDLHKKVDIAQENAKKALKQGRRNTAKHELKRKKVFLDNIDRILSMVDNLTVINMKIEDALTDQALLSAYEAGKKALSSVLKDKQMNVDSVTESMLDLQDLLETQSEISAAISGPVIDENTSELDEELEALLKEDEARQKDEDTLKALQQLTINNKDIDISLPNSPSTTPANISASSLS